MRHPRTRCPFVSGRLPLRPIVTTRAGWYETPRRSVMKSPLPRWITICAVALMVGAIAPASSGQNVGSLVSITDVLGKTLGVSGDQAAGGVGSILSMAQNKLAASDYTKDAV